MKSLLVVVVVTFLLGVCYGQCRVFQPNGSPTGSALDALLTPNTQILTGTFGLFGREPPSNLFGIMPPNINELCSWEIQVCLSVSLSS